MVKKQNKMWIWIALVVVALLLFSQYGLSRASSPIEVTASYYDADGVLIGTSGRGLQLQSILSPGIEILSSETVGIQLVFTVTNTGNIDAVINTGDVYVITTTPTNYITTPASATISPGDSQVFTTEIIDVTGYTGDQTIRMEFVSSGDDISISESYDWRFNKEATIYYQETANNYVLGSTYSGSKLNIVDGNWSTGAGYVVKNSNNIFFYDKYPQARYAIWLVKLDKYVFLLDVSHKIRWNYM